MKRLPAVLAVSVVTNLLLAAAWWTSPPPSSPSPDDASAVPLASANSPAPASAAATDPAAPVLTPWEQLTADLSDHPTDDATLVARLRAAGFADDIIRAIIRHRIDERYMDEEVALVRSQPPIEYWTPAGATQLNGTPETKTALRRLRRAKQAEVIALLGDAAESPDEIRLRERRFGPIPRETALKAEDLLADYRDLEAELRAGRNGYSNPEYREQMALIAEARDRDLADLLTPEQFAAYQLRSGETSNRMRSTLRDFQPTEAEFLALHELQSAFNAQWGTSIAGLTAEQRRERQTQQEALNQQIASVLGADRYADYELTTSQGYRIAKQVTDRVGLPVENAAAAAPLLQQFTDASRDLARDRSLTPEQRAARQIELQQQVRSELGALFSEEGLAGYEATPMGGWIGRIVPPPTTPNPNRGG